jgi:mono/diheme cytochrome c family protein
MKKILLGVGIGFCLPLLAAFLFINLGGMPVATKGDPLPLEHSIARTAIHRAMGQEVDRTCPIPADEANLRQGARIYQAHCEVCHGSPDQPPTAIASGMFPQPPPLVKMDQKGVTDDSTGESYWKVKNGIRLTGMPGYVDSLSDTDLWRVSLLLKHAHDLPPSVRADLSKGIR